MLARSIQIRALSALAPGAENSVRQDNDGYAGIIFFIEITASGGVFSLTVKLQAFDAVASQWQDVPGATTAALAVVGRSLLMVYPGTIETSNVRVSFPLPAIWRVVSTVATNSATFSISAHLIPKF